KSPSEVRLTVGQAIDGNSAPLEQVLTVDPARGVNPTLRAKVLANVKEQFPIQFLWDPICNFVMNLKQPTFRYNAKLTAALAERPGESVPPSGKPVAAGTTTLNQGELITPAKYQALQQAQEAYERQLARDHPSAAWLSRLGRALIVLILTVAGTLYIARLSN